MKCPKCKKEIEDDSLYCEYCGAKIAKSQAKNLEMWIVGVLFAMFFLPGLVFKIFHFPGSNVLLLMSLVVLLLSSIVLTIKKICSKYKRTK